MKKHKLNNFTKGWMIGDFEPNIIRTKNFEFMVRQYSTGDTEPKHIHKVADEITVITGGKFTMNEEILISGDIIHLLPGDSSDFKCLENGTTAVIKTPSVSGDKFILN